MYIEQRSRGKAEIIASILQATTGGATKSKIMYRSMIGMARINRYLPLLLKNGLVLFDPDTNTYMISKKGYQFVQTVYNIKSLLENRNR